MSQKGVGEQIVVSHSPIVSKLGIKIFKMGGNAFDAAIASSLAMGIVDPGLSGIGGGGFILFFNRESGLKALDYREVAPKNIDVNPYKVEISNMAIGYKAIAVPGTIKGLITLHQEYGYLPLKRIFHEAIDLALRGITVSKLWNYIFEKIPGVKEKVIKHPESRRIFTKQGESYKPGEKLTQKELAKTLEYIYQDYGESFYRGWIAEEISKYITEGGGYIDARDLRDYRVKWRDPINLDIDGFTVYSMPPPGSGIIISEALKTLESIEIDKYNYNELIYKLLSIALIDRVKYIADPEFSDIDPYYLLSDKHIEENLDYIESNRLDEIRVSELDRGTMFLITADKYGNIVALNETLECFMGSGVTIPSFGILMNDEIHDFSLDDSSPNYIMGGKRPASSMSPTIIFKDDEPILAIGASGGLRIVSSIIQTLTLHLYLGLDLDEALHHPRIHLENNKLIVESKESVPPGTTRSIFDITKYIASPFSEKHSIYMGNVEALEVKNGKYYGYSDPRKGYGVEVL